MSGQLLSASARNRTLADVNAAVMAVGNAELSVTPVLAFLLSRLYLDGKMSQLPENSRLFSMIRGNRHCCRVPEQGDGRRRQENTIDVFRRGGAGSAASKVQTFFETTFYCGQRYESGDW